MGTLHGMSLSHLNLAFIGCGRVARALALAMHHQGVSPCALASRNPVSAQDLAQRLGQPALACTAEQAVKRADVVLLSVPDDAIVTTTQALAPHWHPGQAVVHLSGATELRALDAAAQAGAEVGGFHPLQIFSAPEQAAQLLAGSSVAIEAGPALEPQLLALAHGLGMHPIHLPQGARARYHAGAGFAASFLLPVLDEAVQLWQSFGVERAHALQALLPLVRGTVEAVEKRGIAGALSGPISRGDAGVVAKHLQALEALGPEHVALYRLLAGPQLDMAQATGRCDPDQAARMRSVLGSALDSALGHDGVELSTRG